MGSIDAFLLSRDWRDQKNGIEITLWCASAKGPIRARWQGREATMFVLRGADLQSGRREPTTLLTRDGMPVDALHFRTQRELVSERDRLRSKLVATFESDIKPADRFLMERFVTFALTLEGESQDVLGVQTFSNPRVRASDCRAERLRVLSLDIESDGWDGPILSVALASENDVRVDLVGEGHFEHHVFAHQNERELLSAVFAAIRERDPDVITGWNVVEFDLSALERRAKVCGLPFTIGRAGEPARVLPGAARDQIAIARVPGRAVLDGIAGLKNATWSFERYSLEHVSRALLGRGKKISKTGDALEEIRRMHREDPQALVEYNLEDARLALDIFNHAELLEFATERARLSGLPLDRVGGSVAAFDHLYLPRLHRKGRVAPDVPHESPMAPSPGGHVLESVPDLYSNVISFDFRSLYPSIIRTFHIDPLAMWNPGEDAIPGFDGASFSREDAILPAIVARLGEARKDAADSGNAALSRAIKILMNSFYGVLGTPGCRFFDPRLASSITRRGHEIIEGTRVFLEGLGHRVIYGDTDSLFLALDPKLSLDECRSVGSALAERVNAFWRERLGGSAYRLESFLELRLDSVFSRFLMPRSRAGDRGSKKRYAGATLSSDGRTELVIRGLEAVRTDWSPLSRNVQRELLLRVFSDQPFEDWLRSVRQDLFAGKLDQELVFHKRLRREADEYGGSPPHVAVARMLESEIDAAPREVDYVLTVRGPRPLGQVDAPIDYELYAQKQLAPACDVVLQPLGVRFDQIAGTQLSLF